MTTTPTIWKAQQRITPTGVQTDPVIIPFGEGYLVVWTEETGGPTGTSPGIDIVARSIGFEGVGTAPFQLNQTFVLDDELNPALDGLPSGRFVVAYEDRDADGTSIRAETFNFGGASTGFVTIREDTDSAVLASPAVVMRSDGSYSVFYTRNGALLQQNVTADNVLTGVAIGRSSALYTISNPDVDSTTAGNTLLAYEKINADGSQTDHDVWFEGPRTIFIDSGLEQRDPHVAGLTFGGYVGVWWEANFDGSNNHIRAVVVGEDGTIIRDSFRVNTVTPGGSRHNPDVTALPDGGFVVTWGDALLDGIQMRRFDDQGQPVGAQITAGEEGTETNPAIATLSDGRFVLGFQQAAGDDDIYATIFDPRTSPIGGTPDRDVLTSRRDGAVVKGFGGGDSLFGYESIDTLDGGPGADRFFGGGALDTLIGGSGGDDFVFDDIALADAQLAVPVFDRVMDYNQGGSGRFNPAENDDLDIFGIIGDVHAGGQPASALVRAVRDAIDGSSVLQIDPNGTVSGAQWTTIARLYGVDMGHRLTVVTGPPLPNTDPVFVQEGNATTQLANFDGALGSDLLWRNDNGMVGMWTMDGPSILTPRDIALVGREWHIAGMGDFGGDDRGDILWRRDDGLVGMWQMNGSAVTLASDVMTVDDAWRIVGTADFGNDGRDDILWRHDNGTVGLWEMNGTAVLLAGNIHPVDNAWSIAGMGDFGGDGRSDILWRHKDGTVGLWQMNGIRVLSAGDIQEVSSDWQIAGTGDFNGDSRTDILWRSDTGMVGLWTMNGAAVETAQNIMEVTSDWHIVGTGDFNHDGRSDILWNREDGTVGIWEMDGSSVLLAQTVSTVASQWTNVAHHNDLV